MTIEKIANKLKIDQEVVKKIIVAHHEMKALTPSNELVEIDLMLDLSSIDMLKKIAKQLKVSVDAALVGIVLHRLEQEEKDKKNVSKSKKTLSRRRNSKVRN